MSRDEHVLCQVCSRPCARFNYKGIVCDNCRVFFFRKVTLKRGYICSSGGNCKISPKIRINCSACRFQKCIEAGMDPEEVGKRFDKRLVVAHFTKKMVKTNIFRFHEPCVAYGARVLPMIGKAQNVFEFVHVMMDFERITHNYTGKSPQFAKACMNVSFGEVINNPALSCERDTAAFSEVGSLPNIVQIPFSKIFCRVLTSFLDFVSAIEEIQKLSFLDRIKICQYNIMDFVKYNLCFLQYDSGVKGIPLARAPRFIVENAPDDFWSSYPPAYFRFHKQIVDMFVELKITKEEYILVLIIGLLATPDTLSEEGTRTICIGRERYSVLLADLIKQTTKEGGKMEMITRVRKILSILPLVKEASRISHQKQREMVFKNYGNMNNRLGWEIHIKEYK